MCMTAVGSSIGTMAVLMVAVVGGILTLAHHVTVEIPSFFSLEGCFYRPVDIEELRVDCNYTTSMVG